MVLSRNFSGLAEHLWFMGMLKKIEGSMRKAKIGAQESIEPQIRSFSTYHNIGFFVNSFIIALIFFISFIAFDRNSIYQDMSFVRNEQIIRFQKLVNTTRALMKASANDALPEQVINNLIGEIEAGTNAVHKDIGKFERLRQRLAWNPLEQLNPHPAESDGINELLDARLRNFLEHAKRIAEVPNITRRSRYAFWGPIDFAIASEGAMMQQFHHVIQLSYTMSRDSIDFAKNTVGALIIFLLLLLFVEGVFIFRPMLKRLISAQINKEKYEEQLSTLALTDNLTALSNRAAFNLRFNDLIDMEWSSGKSFSLLLMDLDHFKSINDTLGHAVGDLVLKHFARQLRAALRSDDFVARLGGDEFAVLLPSINDKETLQNLIERIEFFIKEPLEHDARFLELSVSIGASLYPAHGQTEADLMRCADLALHVAKSHRSISVIYDATMMAETREQAELKAALPSALSRGEFVPYYQPKIDMSTGAHAGFEALIRWRHPTHGVLPPGRFLTLFNTPLLLEQMTIAVVDAVARDLRAWREAGVRVGTVAINMPEVLLAHETGYHIFERAIGRHGVDWSDFSVEITEDVFLNRHSDRVSDMVIRLRRHGVHVSLDDFGTGFASLTHLRAFPFDEIKIDRSFTIDIGQDIRAEQIIRAMIDLARNLGKTVIAEGVETVEHVRFLVEAGCQFGQGYLFSKPIPSSEVAAFIASAPVANVFVAQSGELRACSLPL
jgi:diguanylate cyclase